MNSTSVRLHERWNHFYDVREREYARLGYAYTRGYANSVALTAVRITKLNRIMSRLSHRINAAIRLPSEQPAMFQ